MQREIIYSSASFSLALHTQGTAGAYTMQMHIPVVNTRDLPHTLDFLQQHFPGVLQTRCFNDQNLPFMQEVQATEIGHLLEHMLLKQLCIEKIALGSTSAVFNGKTHWDWVRDPRGVFSIYIDIEKRDLVLLANAVQKMTTLLETLLTMEQVQTVSPKIYRQPQLRLSV